MKLVNCSVSSVIKQTFNEHSTFNYKILNHSFQKIKNFYQSTKNTIYRVLVNGSPHQRQKGSIFKAVMQKVTA